MLFNKLIMMINEIIHYCNSWIKQTNKRCTKFVIYHSKDTLKCIPIPNRKLKFLKKSLQKYLLTQPLVKTQLHNKTKCNLPNKSVQNKQEKKSQLTSSAIPHHQDVQCDIKHDKSHENVKLTMDNLHTQKTEEKSIQTEDQPKIANFQVKSQINIQWITKMNPNMMIFLCIHY